MAATPLVAILMHQTRVPMITPREAKTHGIAGTINGDFSLGETVLVIDDLVTHADSKLEAIRVLEDEWPHGTRCRRLGGPRTGRAEQLADAGYTLHAALTLSQLLDYWRASGAIDEATFERVAPIRPRIRRK